MKTFKPDSPGSGRAKQGRAQAQCGPAAAGPGCAGRAAGRRGLGCRTGPQSGARGCFRWELGWLWGWLCVRASDAGGCCRCWIRFLEDGRISRCVSAHRFRVAASRLSAPGGVCGAAAGRRLPRCVPFWEPVFALLSRGWLALLCGLLGEAGIVARTMRASERNRWGVFTRTPSRR